MWRISRNLIFHRWPKKQQKHGADSVAVCKAISICHPIERKSSNDQGKKEKKFKQQERFWNSNNVRFLLFKSAIMEKAGWLGTVSIMCFNLHFKHFQLQLNLEKRSNYCIFSRNVFAIPQAEPPKHKGSKQSLVDSDNCSEKKIFYLFNTFSNEEKDQKLSIEADSLRHFQNLAAQYATAVFNSTGISNLKKDRKKKAFRCFQKAARLGSKQAFYNLGLCFELGEGTKKNMSRAAFCYRKAAMSGHGLASFNLAVFFLRGVGGLPVDPEAAEQLLTQAAEKGVPEAQLYIGLHFLKQEKYSEAFQLFSILADKNVLEGKYYLGMCYENGWGIHKDQKIATELFSEAAASGHSNSVLKLSRYYEEGIGGCEADLDFSTALCQLLDDQKNKELQESLIRLKLKKATYMVKKPVVDILSCMRKESTLHNSKSVPAELNSYQKDTRVVPRVPSYLDIASLFLPIPGNLKQQGVICEKPPLLAPVSVFGCSVLAKT